MTAGNSSQDAGGAEYAHNSLRHQFGEVSTSGDEQLKVRKPYTITKQRERWTEEEHQKFLEALKLYGRAWRRIEEHIGTKTAVQIRSHAQKFFSKLEKEQAGGVVAGAAQDIDIPPPRPKRKPSHPYPRKATTAAPESPMASPSPAALPSSAHDLLVRPILAEGIRSASPVEMGKVLERCKAELKLFGQTVVVPTPARPVALVLEGKVQGNADGSELQDTSHSDISKMRSLSVASDVSMLVSENDSSNGQSGNKREMKNRNATVPSSTHRPGEDPESSALHYSKLWESMQAPEPVYPFNPGVDMNFWQGYSRAVAALWPSFSGASLNGITASVMRTIMAGASPEAHLMDNSPAALAAATVAAASAWWALQGSAPTSFHAQRVPPTEILGHEPVPMDTQGQEVENMEVENDQLPRDDDDTLASPMKADKTVHQSFKRQGSCFEGADGGKKRIKLRSFVNEDVKARPPSSSGSDDGNDRAELAKQLNGDADASGNSGPSSNSSRCGNEQATPKSEESSSDKEKTGEEEALTDEVLKSTLKDSGVQHASSHHFVSHIHKPRKGLRSARPCRSSGSDGEQRKEVSQEGRIAFQALFSHSKLPQTFYQRVPFARDPFATEDHFRRPPHLSDVSDLESVNEWHQNYSNDYNSINNNYNYNNNVYLNRLFRVEASDNLNNKEDDDETKSALDSSSQQLTPRSRRRSGFVPYRRAVEGGESVSSGAASCRMEETQLVNISRLVEEEVKASSCS